MDGLEMDIEDLWLLVHLHLFELIKEEQIIEVIKQYPTDPYLLT